MKEITWDSPDGRLYKVMCPDFDTEHPERGIIIGPPDLTALDLPHAIMVRLHNNLFHRGLLTERHFRARREEAQGALLATFAVDVERIYQEYVNANPPPSNDVPLNGSGSSNGSGSLAVSTGEGVRNSRAQASQSRRQQRL